MLNTFAFLSQIIVFASLVQGAPKYTIIDLGTLGSDSGHGNAINDHNQIVGESENKEGERRAFLYENGKTIDLNDLIAPGQWTHIAAKDINNKGQITGYGINAKGEPHAFLMTPVTKCPRWQNKSE